MWCERTELVIRVYLFTQGQSPLNVIDRETLGGSEEEGNWDDKKSTDGGVVVTTELNLQEKSL